MMIRRALVLKGFLNQIAPNRREALEKLLPPQEQRMLSDLPVYPIDRDAEETDILQKVHWSWFLPTLKSHSEKEQKLFLAALLSPIAEPLARALHISLPKENISPTGKSFLQGILFQSLVGEKNRLLPISYLPPSPLHFLLHLSKKDLTELIDDLSMYDLASELRQIVETKILKRIYSFLSEEQRKFLKIAMVHKEKSPLPRMGLDKWDQSEEALHHALHRRGLARLGSILSRQDPDLIWYVCHQLDIGRGNTLFKICEKEGPSGWAETVLKQIEDWREWKQL
ncbi:MAG: hypothetical protein HY069_02410 [Chlamydiia bacterium]|nr:hypothetical protein [Chlamydiia bacterium]